MTRDEIPYPAESRWLVVYEGEKQIYEEEIPDPPKLKIDSVDQNESGVTVTWSPEAPDEECCLWYLVHSYDAESEVWRGVAPRLQERSLLIPRHLFAREPQLRFRVLATSGIATGMAEGQANLKGWQYQRPDVGLMGVTPNAAGPVRISAVLTATASEADGRDLDYMRAVWYGPAGEELARGPSFDLRKLAPGKQMIRFAVPLPAGGFAARSWLVEGGPGGFLLHQQIPDLPPKPATVEYPSPEHPHPHPH